MCVRERERETERVETGGNRGWVGGKQRNRLASIRPIEDRYTCGHDTYVLPSQKAECRNDFLNSGPTTLSFSFSFLLISFSYIRRLGAMIVT